MAGNQAFALAVRAVAFDRRVDASALGVAFEERRGDGDGVLDCCAVALERVGGEDACGGRPGDFAVCGHCCGV